MDRKIELEQISDEMFNDILLAVNTEILEIARSAQDKINELLSRFNIQCSISLNYDLPSEQPSTPNESVTITTPDLPKKRRSSKKKKNGYFGLTAYCYYHYLIAFKTLFNTLKE